MAGPEDDRYVALLRGINVGGKNRLAMSDLVGLFERLGCRSVRSYIQSGNVVFEADPDELSRVEREVPTGLERDFGLTVPVIIRSASEFRTIVTRNPFLDERTDTSLLHVGMLADIPTDTAVESLDPERSPGDRFQVVGRDVYFHVPGGMARTKLTTAYFDRRLDTVMTVRNWRTVQRLWEMLSSD